MKMQKSTRNCVKALAIGAHGMGWSPPRAHRNVGWWRGRFCSVLAAGRDFFDRKNFRKCVLVGNQLQVDRFGRRSRSTEFPQIGNFVRCQDCATFLTDQIPRFLFDRYLFVKVFMLAV